MFPVNLPNVLTILRILLVPVLIVALLDKTPEGDLVAAVVFVLASLTDLLDGHIARSRASETDFGKLMDPLADKLLIIGALLALVSLGRLESWVAMVVIAREFAVTVLRMAANQQGAVIGASYLGKAKTATQVLMVILLITVGSDELWVEAVVYLAVAATVISGLDYFFGLKRHLSRARK